MERLNTTVEKFTVLMKEAEKYIWKNPETGYKEFNTDKYLRENFEKLGYGRFILCNANRSAKQWRCYR